MLLLDLVNVFRTKSTENMLAKADIQRDHSSQFVYGLADCLHLGFQGGSRLDEFSYVSTNGIFNCSNKVGIGILQNSLDLLDAALVLHVHV